MTTHDLAALLALDLAPSGKVLLLEALRRGAGRHLVTDLAQATRVHLGEAGRGADALRRAGLAAASGFDHLQVDEGSPWLAAVASKPSTRETQHDRPESAILARPRSTR